MLLTTSVIHHTLIHHRYGFLLSEVITIVNQNQKVIYPNPLKNLDEIDGTLETVIRLRLPIVQSGTRYHLFHICSCT